MTKDTIHIGVISDTHNLLRPEARIALAGSDHIIHAGDICGPQVLEELSRIAPVTAVRGSLGVGIKKLLSSTGHYERYLELIPPELREPIKFSLASSWVPASQAMAHCQAVDTLQLGEKEVQEIGAEMAELKKTAPRRPEQPGALKKTIDAVIA